MDRIKCFSSWGDVVLDVYGWTMAIFLIEPDPECQDFICIERSKQYFEAAFDLLRKGFLLKHCESESQKNVQIESPVKLQCGLLSF